MKPEKKPSQPTPEEDSFTGKLKELHQKEEQLIQDRIRTLRSEIDKLTDQFSLERETKEKLQKKLAEQEKRAEEEYLKRREKEKKLEEETTALTAKKKDYEEEVSKREALQLKLDEELSVRKEQEQQIEDERLKRKGTEKEWEEEKELRQEKEKEAEEWKQKAEEREKRISELEESFAYERGIISGEVEEGKKRLGQLEKEKGDLEGQVREYRQKEEEWGSEKKSQIEEIERQKEVNEDLNTRLEQLKERTVNAISKAKEVQSQKEENWEREREGFTKRLDEGEVKVKLLREEITDLQKRVIEQEAEKEKLSQMVQKYVEAQQGWEEEQRKAAGQSGVSEEEKAGFISEMNSAVERLKGREAEVFSLKKQVQELQGKLEVLEFELKKAADFGESLLVEKDALIEEIAVLNEGFEPKIKFVEQELGVVKRESQEKTRAIQSLKNTIARLEGEREELLQKMNAMQDEKAEVQKRLDAAWETQEDARRTLDSRPKGRIDDESLKKAQEFFQKGKEFFQKQQYRKALTNFEEAVNLDPTKAEYYTGMGLVHSMEFSRHKIDIPKAESCFLQAIRIDPKNARNYYYLGVIYKSQGQDGKAKSYFRKAVEYQPDYPEAKEQLQLLSA